MLCFLVLYDKEFYKHNYKIYIIRGIRANFVLTFNRWTLITVVTNDGFENTQNDV